MFGRKKDNDKLDYATLNELIRFGNKFTKMIFGLSIVGLILVVTYINKEWKLMKIFGDILSILSPFFIGFIIAWLLDPIVDFLQKKGVKRGIGSLFVYVVLLSVTFITGYLLFPSLIHQINEMVNGAPELIKSISDQLDDIILRISKLYNINQIDLKNKIFEVINNIFYSFTVDGPSAIVGIAKSLVSGGINIALGFVIGFYMLLDFDGVRKQLGQLVPKKKREEVHVLTEKLNQTLRSYVYGTLLVMFVLFICQSIGMSIAGMKAPLVFGLFCAITNIIPYLGPYLGGAPAVLIAFTIDPKIGIGVLISVIVCQLLESYLLTPTIMSKTMKLHPVTIIIGLLIFSHFFGIIGMLFATPVISCGKIIINHFLEKYNVFENDLEDEYD